MDIGLPKDLINIIEQLIIYEDMLKEKDNCQYEYAYIEETLEDTYEKENSTIIEILL